MPKTFKLVLVNEQDPTDIRLERTGIDETAADKLLGYAPVLDSVIKPQQGLAGLFGPKKP